MKTNPKMPRPALLTLVSLLLTTFAAPTFAQAPRTPEEEERARRLREGVETMEKIEVISTGTRSPKAVDKIPGAVTVITEDEIQHTRAITQDATAVLARTVPGYSESLPGDEQTPARRCAAARRCRLFDGIPQTSPCVKAIARHIHRHGLIGPHRGDQRVHPRRGHRRLGRHHQLLSKSATKPGTEMTLTTLHVAIPRRQEGYKVALDAKPTRTDHFDLRWPLPSSTRHDYDSATDGASG